MTAGRDAATRRLVCWNGEECPRHARGIGLSGHGEAPNRSIVVVSKGEFDQLCASARMAAFVMWYNGTKTMPQEHSPDREVHHQRVDHASPGDTIALNVEDLNKNDTPELGQWSRVLETGDEVVSPLTHTRL